MIIYPVSGKYRVLWLIITAKKRKEGGKTPLAKVLKYPRKPECRGRCEPYHVLCMCVVAEKKAVFTRTPDKRIATYLKLKVLISRLNISAVERNTAVLDIAGTQIEERLNIK